MHRLPQLSPRHYCLFLQIIFFTSSDLIFNLIFFFLASISLFPFLCPSLPLTSLFPIVFAVPWLLLPHKKGRSVLPFLLRVKARLGLHRAKHKRLWSVLPSLYKILGILLAYSSLRCPMVRPLLPLTLRCFPANLGLLVLPRLQIQERF